MERRELQVTYRAHLPAVATVGSDVLVRHRQAAVELRLETRDVLPARGYLRQRLPRFGEGGARRGADRRILLQDERLRLRRPGHQLAVEADPVRAELLPEAGPVHRRAHDVQQI